MKEQLRKHFGQLVSLPDEEFDDIYSHFEVQDFKKGNWVFREGDAVNHAHYVVKGLLRLIYDEGEGKEHFVSFAMEDWWETDFAALYAQEPAKLSLQALEDTILLSLSLQNYELLCAKYHSMAHFFLKKANRGHIASQQRIISFLTANAQNRYEEVIKRYPSLVQRIPKTLLATYLGVSRETLSRK